MKTNILSMVGFLLFATTSVATHIGINQWEPELFHTCEAGCDAQDQADKLFGAAEMWGHTHLQCFLRYQSSMSDNPYTWELFRDDISLERAPIS